MATPAEIHAVADSIVSTGQRPTLAAVRAALGGGSYTTISEALKSWTGGKVATAVAVEAPQSVTEAAQALAVSVWQAAHGAAAGQLATERQALEDARQALESDRLEAVQLADQLSVELEQAQAHAQQLSQELAQAQQATLDQQAAAHALDVRATAAEAALAESRVMASALADDLTREREQARAATIEAAELRGQLLATKAANPVKAKP